MEYYYHSLRSDIFRVFRNKIMIIGFAVYLAISFYALWDYGLLISYADYETSETGDGIVRVIDYSDDDYAAFVRKCAEFREEHNVIPSRSDMAHILDRSSWCPDITVATSDWSIIFFLCLLTDIVISGENISYLVVDGNSRGRVYRSKIFNAFVIAAMLRFLAFMLIYLMNYALHGASHASMLLDLLMSYLLGLFPTFGVICFAAMMIFILWQRYVFYILAIPYSYIQMKVIAFLVMRLGVLRPDALDYTLLGMMSGIYFRRALGYTFLCMFYPFILFAVTSCIGIFFFKRRTLQ